MLGTPCMSAEELLSNTQGTIAIEPYVNPVSGEFALGIAGFALGTDVKLVTCKVEGRGQVEKVLSNLHQLHLSGNRRVVCFSTETALRDLSERVGFGIIVDADPLLYGRMVGYQESKIDDYCTRFLGFGLDSLAGDPLEKRASAALLLDLNLRNSVGMIPESLYRALSVSSSALALTAAHGFPVDVATAAKVAEQLHSLYLAEESNIQQTAKKAGMGKFSVSSYRNVGELLYEKLRLPVRSRTAKGTPQTDAQTLELLDHAVARSIATAKKILNAERTAKKLVESAQSQGGRIFPTWQAVTTTGILTPFASDPPVQSLPSTVYSALRTFEDLSWFGIALDNPELRYFAQVSADQKLQKMIDNGVYTKLGDLILEIAGHMPSWWRERKVVEMICGGYLTPQLVAEYFGMTQEAAKRILMQLGMMFPRLMSWVEQTQHRATSDFVALAWDYAMVIPETKSGELERCGVSYTARNVSGMLVHMIIAEVYESCAKQQIPVRAILPVGSTVYVQMADDPLAELAAIFQQKISRLMQGSLPNMRVDVAVGQTLFEVSSKLWPDRGQA